MQISKSKFDTEGTIAEPENFVKFISGGNLNNNRLTIFAVVCAAISSFLLLIAFDSFARTQILNGVIGIERNVYEKPSSWIERTMTWAPDPILEVMPEIPVGASAQFVRRPESGSTDWMFAATSPKAKAQNLTEPDLLELSEAFDCERVAQSVNQAITLDRKNYWLLWRENRLVYSEDGGRTCRSPRTSILRAAVGNSSHDSSVVEEAVSASFRLVGLSIATAGIDGVSPGPPKVSVLMRSSQLFHPLPDVVAYQGSFSPKGIFSQAIPNEESRTPQNQSALSPKSRGPPQDINIATAGNDGSKRLYRRVGITNPFPELVDRAWDVGIKVRTPFPPHQIRVLDGRIVADLPRITENAKGVLPQLEVASLRLSEVEDVEGVLASFNVRTKAGLLAFQTTKLGNLSAHVLADRRQDGMASATPVPQELAGLPDSYWYRSVAATQDGKHIYFAATPTEKIGNVHRPTIFYSADGGLNFRRLEEQESIPTILPLSLTGSVFFAFLAVGAYQNIRNRKEDEDDPARSASAGLTDEPIGLDGVDVIGLRKIALALSRVIHNVGTSPPLTFGIAGSWGSGKSSLMQMLMEDLRSRWGRVVSFNAWHHQSEDHILAALLEAVRTEAVPPIWTGSGFYFRLLLLWHRKARLLNFIIPYCAVMGALALVYFSDGSARQSIDAMFQNSEGLSVVGAKAIAGLPLFVAFYRLLKPFSFSAKLLASQTSSVTSVLGLENKLSVRHNFQKQFRDVTEVIAKSGGNLTIIVDDLDRCSAKNVRMVLDAVNFLTSAGKCYVVLGYDRERVMNLLINNYVPEERAAHDGGTSAATDGNIAERYLKKIVNIEITVPKFNTQMARTLVRTLSSSAERSDEVVSEIKERRNKRRRLYIVDALMGISFTAVAATVLICAALALFTSASDGLETPVRENAVANKANSQSDANPAVSDEQVALATEGTQNLTLAKTNRPGDLLPALAAHKEPASAGLTNALMVLLSGLLLTAGLSLIFYLLRQRERQLNSIQDPDVFVQAMREWVPFVQLRDPTPRNTKQFVNRTRLAGERLKEPEIEVPLLSQRTLVALSALDTISPELIDHLISKTRSESSLSEFRKAHKDLPVDVLEKAFKIDAEDARLFRRLG